MVCFCKPSLTPLLSASARLSTALSATVAIPALPPILLSLSETLTLSPPLPFESSMLTALEQFQLPSLSISAGFPTLMGLVNLSMQLQAHLGIDLQAQGGVEALVDLMAQIDLDLLGPLGGLPVGPLMRLSALVALSVQIKAILGIDLMSPPDDFAAALTASLQIFLPTIPYPSFLLPKLQLMAGLRPLLALAIALKIDLSDTIALAAALRVMVGLQLKAAAVPPTLMSAISLLSLLPSLDISLTEQVDLTETINAALGRLLAGFRLLFQAMLKLQISLPLPTLLPAISMPEIELILRLNLPQLAALNWQIPATLPILETGLPMVSLLARLQLIVPAVRLSPCGFGCPLGGR
jgi:hypothetical protein